LPDPIIADVFKIRFNWVWGAQNAYNVFHVRATAMDVDDVAQAVPDNWHNDQIKMVSSGASIDSIDVTPLDGTSVPFNLHLGSASFVGADGTSAVPATAAIVKMVTAKRGKSYRGRMFLPYVGEGSQVAGTLSGSIAADSTAKWVLWANGMSADGVHLCIVSALLGTSEDVTNLAVETSLGTQRRRQTRVRTA